MSSTGQVKGYGPQRQREDIAAFADSAGYEIVRYYEDANTGTDITAEVRDDPMRKAMILIQGVFAQLEKDLLVKKLARGRDDKRKAAGRCEGRLPFGGYEGEEVVLAEIKRLCRKPRGGDYRSYGEIADALHGVGFRTRYGKRWLPQTIRKIALQQGFRQP